MHFFRGDEVSAEVLEFGTAVAELSTRTLAFNGKAVRIHIILSPKAGIFARPPLLREHLSRLRLILLDAAERRPPNPACRTSRITSYNVCYTKLLRAFALVPARVE